MSNDIPNKQQLRQYVQKRLAQMRFGRRISKKTEREFFALLTFTYKRAYNAGLNARNNNPRYIYRGLKERP